MRAQRFFTAGIFLFACTILFCRPGLCERVAASAAPATKAAATPKTAAGKPQIITDEKNNTVRVLINGKEILTIDADGVQVHGNLKYTGYEMDNGDDNGNIRK